jgi:hypothetical protein
MKINDKINELNTYIQNLDGYKISDTHFKIGAKLHLENFYYAKRLFQNSYYTSRMAMLLAIEIKKLLHEKDFNKQEPITLVGYEMYSELLLSLVKKFLYDDSDYSNINHIITVEEDERMKYLPDVATISNNIIIIVPIANTGSTANKIENYIKTITKDQAKFILEPFNVLQTIDPNKPQYRCDGQKRFVELKTTWHDPSDCPRCFNNDLSWSLFETDKSSLTPALIFDLPTIKEINNNITEEINNIEFKSLIYRKKVRNKYTSKISLN